MAALLMVDGVISEIEEAATKWVRDRLAEFSVEIKNTTRGTRGAFLKIQEQTATPEVVSISLRDNIVAATRDSKGHDLAMFPGHIYSDSDGRFPAKLNDWETEVILAEKQRESCVAWYRNPWRASPAALRIAYQDETAAWTSLQVDFIIVSRRDDGTLGISVVDPHGDHLPDARAKLLALADYAEKYEDQFVRIESVAEGSDGNLRALDLREGKVRESVRAFQGGKVSALYESTVAIPFR